MIKAVKKDTGSFIYLRVKKHACPDCGKEMKVVKMKKTVKASSKEASGFNLNAAGHSLGEKVKFIWYEFKCPVCELHFTEDALRRIEENAKKDAAEAKKAEKKAVAKAKKAEKKAATKAKKAEKKAAAALIKEEKRLAAERLKAEKKAAAKADKNEKKATAKAKKAEKNPDKTV